MFKSLLKKLLSRKFLLTIGVAILEVLGIEVPKEVIAVVGTYVIGQSIVDASEVKAVGEVQKTEIAAGAGVVAPAYRSDYVPPGERR